MTLDEAKVEILKFLGVPHERATAVEIEYNATTPIKVSVDYEIFEGNSITYETREFVTREVTDEEE